jgi:hypothetical protein
MKHDKQPLDLYEMDFMPMEMKAYLRNYGFSFSKKACDYAVSLMKKENPSTKKEEKIEPWSKEQVDEMLKKFNITLENNVGYNATYVANMLKADMFKSSIVDEQRLALGVKDIIDDYDASPRLVFKKWITHMDDSGTPIEWSELI